ncbi:helix-turn-helix domain-containing protein [Aurantimonas sp. DM33-3]|uniref:helix-turn-helix transcriptional regulator n=1 Tax=Aurantimonas sp. DM33-3 TaxID=2766955 RepID=UPI001AEDE700|nr:helix-turn-helix domain-containing protein [Aurantimonas sp. DM33-3]
MNASPPPSTLMTEQEVADRQKRSIKTLQNQRVTGFGIPFLKLGRCVRYRLADVEAWEEAQRRQSTSELA